MIYQVRKRFAALAAVLAAVYLCLGPQVGADSLIQVTLNKSTAMQAGRLGQPVTSYYTEVNIGTPKKPFKLLVDVNARETWVPHYSKLGLVLNRLHYKTGYSKKDSSSSQKETQEYTFEYGGCDLTGKGYEDDMVFSQVAPTALGFNKNQPFRQRFLAISAASNDRLSDMPYDGVLSLNPVFMSPTGTRSALVNLNQARLISELKFGLYLDASADKSEGGELMLGGTNPEKYVGDIKYHPLLVQQEGWEIKVNNVMLGGQVVSCFGQPDCRALLSTGLNDLYGPREDVLAMMKLLGVSRADPKEEQKEGLHEIDCLRVAEVPELSFNIDGIKYIVPPTSYIKKKVDGIFFKSATCYVSILASNSTNQWLLGTNFLQNYYSVFDFNRRQVGFAKKRL